MKKKLLAILAMGMLVLAPSSHALVISISGSGNSGIDGQWDISTIYGTGDSLLDTLDDQIWFGDASLAELFATTLAGGLGFPNNNGLRGPHFLAVTDGSLLAFADPFQGYRFWLNGTANFFQVTGSDLEWTWAVASRVASVPEPGTLALLGLGLVGLGFARRRKHA